MEANRGHDEGEIGHNCILMIVWEEIIHIEGNSYKRGRQNQDVNEEQSETQRTRRGATEG